MAGQVKTNPFTPGDGRPLALLLAGTPQLDSKIRKAGSTFAEWSRFLSIGRLLREHAREALLKPFGCAAEEHEHGAVKRALDAAQNYSYFIQLLGELLWDANSSRIDPRALSLSLPKFRSSQVPKSFATWATFGIRSTERTFSPESRR